LRYIEAGHCLKRSNQTENEKQDERAALRDRMRKLRERKTNEETEYEMICQKHKAKKGMRKFKEKGRVFDFQKRSANIETEMSDFKNFKKKGNTYSEFLDAAKPDIVD
jgi:hypothetical protein